MTDCTIALPALLEKISDASMPREMIGFAAQYLMALKIGMLCGAGPDERTKRGPISATASKAMIGRHAPVAVAGSGQSKRRLASK